MQFHETLNSIHEKYQLDVLVIFFAFICIEVSYVVLHLILCSVSPKYKQSEKKMYILKNLIKGVYLGIVDAFLFHDFVSGFWYFEWNNEVMHTFGILYALPDLISLAQVSGMHFSTIFHHTIVGIFSMINTLNDYEKYPDVMWHGMVFYAFMSMLTGIVNFYLAFRIIQNHPSIRKKLAQTAFGVYALSLCLNWSFQIYIIFRWIDFSITNSIYFYLALLSFIVYDDVKLLSFLRYEASKDFVNLNKTAFD